MIVAKLVIIFCMMVAAAGLAYAFIDALFLSTHRQVKAATAAKAESQLSCQAQDPRTPHKTRDCHMDKS